MGQRFRLKQGFDITGFGPHVQVILRALKKYGMFLADNGSAWYLSGAPDPRWDDNELHQLSQLHGGDFEAVDESSFMVDPNSGQTNVAPLAPTASTIAVEFHCAAADRYLLTADPLLIGALDNACVQGWTRTGQSLSVFAVTANVASAADTLCKPSGHPTRDLGARIGAPALACDSTLRRLPNVWPQNAVGLPAAAIPNAIDGSCSVGTLAVFGVVDNRPGMNHRYTASLSTRDQMLGQGWVAAGRGALGVAMCAPAQ